MQLTIGPQAFLDIMAEGQGDIGGAMQPTPAGLWGLSPEILKILPGYGPDVASGARVTRITSSQPPALRGSGRTPRIH
jgi:peptide/nickel transport system substrate-binding protein